MTKNKQKGFTIIEFALVLAVAALIFLVVFLAVPALQRNQRDGARKRDVSNVVQAVVNSVANRNDQLKVGVAYDGAKKTGAADVSKLGEYLDQMSGNVDYVKVNVDGTAKTFTSTQPITPTATSAFLTTGSNPYINAIIVYTGVKCANGGNGGVEVAAKRSAAIAIQVENGGDGKYYCQNAN